jgi:hypothetical protein
MHRLSEPQMQLAERRGLEIVLLVWERHGHLTVFSHYEPRMASGLLHGL